MTIRKEECNDDTLDRINSRCLPMLKDGTLTPEIAKSIIEDEYIRQMIETNSLNVEFPN